MPPELPFPLLLDTDYGSGPLWYRSADDKAAWGIHLDDVALTTTLRDRLVRWTAGDYHLHDDYEGDDPAHQAAWHQEGLELLANLRSELGPRYDIRFYHDLSTTTSTRSPRALGPQGTKGLS
jgi:hypothetical protein